MPRRLAELGVWTWAGARKLWRFRVVLRRVATAVAVSRSVVAASA